MSVRLPGANDLDQYWKNIKEAKDCTRELSDEELRQSGVSDELIENPNYIKRAAFADKMEYFDASFFGLSPKESKIMDPQHRQFLETCYHALEDSGPIPYNFSDKIGVFASSSYHRYMMDHLNRSDVMEKEGFFLSDTLVTIKIS